MKLLIDEKFVYLFFQIVYKPSEEIRKLQKKMASLFEKQKKKGGIIDVEQERNRFLIDITSVCGKARQRQTQDQTPFPVNSLSSLVTDSDTCSRY